MEKEKLDLKDLKNEPGIIFPPKIDNSPAEMIRVAVAKGSDLEKLRGLLDLQKDYEANEAKKAYHIAMALFKVNPPKIDKDKHVKFSTQKGNMEYNHASLANVVSKISAELSKHGLSASWSTKQNGKVMVTCKITHILGHSEETTLSAEADTSGSKNSIQAIGSTITYLERYTLLALTGLATQEMDDDSNSVVEHINKKEANYILDSIAELGIDMDKFCEFMGCDDIKTIRKSDYKKAEVAIEAKRKNTKQ